MIRAGGGILCAGNIVHDLLVRPVESLIFDRTVWVEDIRTSPGGNGANTAYTIARLGTLVRLASIAGADEWGDHVLDVLSTAGVDTSLVVRSALPTPMTVALVRADGARAFFHRPGCAKEPFPIEYAPEFAHFHFGNVFALPAFRPRIAGILAAARDEGMTTSLDAGWDSRGEWAAVTDPVLPHTDILFVNRDEAAMMSGRPDPDGAAAYFIGHGVRVVVVKLGKDGCAVFSPEGRCAVPAFQVDAVDTTGAGDCFAGGLLAALSHGMRLPDAAAFANAVGALNVQELGAVGGVRSFEQTLEWMRATPLASEAPGRH